MGKNGDNLWQVEGKDFVIEAHCYSLKYARKIEREYSKLQQNLCKIFQTRENGKSVYKQVY